MAAERAITAEDIDALRSVNAAEISPDGTRIAYTVSIPRNPFEEDNGPAWSELHVIGSDGVSRPFITGEVNVQDISWTPFGDAIAFRSKRDGDDHTAVYRIALGGGEARRIAAHETAITSYSFSPDGKRLAYLAKDAEDKDKKDLAEKGFDAEVFEEDDRWVKVWIHTIDGDEEARALELDGSASELHWAPIGNQIAVALAPSSRIDDHYMLRKIKVVDSQSSEVLGEIDNEGKLGEVAWNPTATHLAMISAVDKHDPREGRLMVAEASGGKPSDVLPHYPGHVRDIQWIDPERILFLGGEGVQTSFGRVAFNGHAHRDLLGAAGRPAWTSFSVSSGGGQVAFVGQSPQHPAELFRWAVREAEPTRLTHSNPVLEEIRLAPQEVVEFAARDGLELEAILIRPLDEQKGTRYPLILSVHGGPESHHDNGWLTTYSSPGQLGAAHGYAVLYVNYRGSTGRGLEFSKLSQADPGGKEFDDLVDAVEHLIAEGLVDRERVGITGGSYGGYASAWGATKLTEHFAASVMFVGISEKIAKSGTTDIPNEEYLVHARRWPWEKWDFMVERSPVAYVEQARTPILILHGAEDPRVHPSQSLILYRYFKMVGKTPARLIWYPGEGHGNRKAAARMDYNRRMMRWFDHYLKGEGGDPPPAELDWSAHQEADDAAEEGAE
ncbi:MAG: S9 family peptidase [Acidobacteriota bacterium]